MNTADVKRTVSKPVVVGLAMLILGLLIGVAAERYSQKSPAQTRNAQAADTAPDSPVVAAPKQNTPDPFDHDFFDSWDPFREMRAMQAEMDDLRLN